MAGSPEEDFEEDEDEFEDSGLDEAVSNSLYGDRSNPLHPEFDGDYTEGMKKDSSKPYVGSWDSLLDNDQAKKFEKFKAKGDGCPYATIPPGADNLHYCLSDANEGLIEEGIKFSGRVALNTSAEGEAIIPDKNLKNLCSKNYKTCKFFKREEKRRKDQGWLEFIANNNGDHEQESDSGSSS